MNYTKMYQALRKILDREDQIDYAMTGRTAASIELWSRMYAGKAPWLSKTVEEAGIPASIAGEIARLTTLELQSSVEGSARASYINTIYQKVLGKLRVQAEYAFAKGSLVLKPYVTNRGISIQYIQADGFFPLEFDSDQIVKCAFLDQYRKNDNIYSRVELHTIHEDILTIQNRAFVSKTEGMLGSEISVGSVPKWTELEAEVKIAGVQKLPFGYFCVPIGNHNDSSSPVGVSVYARAIGRISEADKRYSQINWEYDSKESAVHIAQHLLKYRKDTDSFEYPGGKERMYRALEYNSGAVDKPFIDTYSPDIRDASFYNGWNQLMRMIEFECNLAYGTLSDPNNTDKTAEEIRASKQRSYSFVADCQMALQRALEDLVDAIAFWCELCGLCPSGSYHISFVWDDSIVVDTEKERQTDRADVSMGVMQLWEYRMKWYGETEAQAKAAVQQPAEVME